MDSNQSQIPVLLKNTHLFRKLAEAALEDLADQFEVSTYSAGATIFRQGDQADSFYMILDGSVKIIRLHNNKTRELALLVRGDYFGEEALITHQPRSATVVASVDTTLLRLTSAQFDQIVRDTPHLRDNLIVAISSRHLSRSKTLTWLNPGEVVYVMARKHTFFLLLNLALPATALLVAISLSLFLYLYLLPGMATGVVIGGISILAAVGWLIWNGVDWGNDYYIVTNQRVVWLEVVAGMYDSRMEAPLSTVLSVGLNTNQLGRAIGYGDVMVRTFTGLILFHHVRNPEQVASMIEEHWQRAKISTREQEGRAMEQAIRQRLGLVPPQTVHTRTDGRDKKPPVMSGIFRTIFADFYNVRITEGGVVTYRKHWYVLLKNTWEQMALITLMIALFLVRLFDLITFPSLGAVIAFTVVASLIVLTWYIYNYLDWRNDVYQVTTEQIVDIEKKPFGNEQKKSAPLESILSIEYERLGLLGIILNFGTVKITVGGTKFDFFYVYNPSQVQQDIFQRMEERKVKKKQAETDAERDRVSEWLATYHRGLEKGAFKPGPIPVPPPVKPEVNEDKPGDAEPGESEEAYY